jgi:hypothetical protein
MVVLTLPVFILVYRIPYFKINGNKKDTGFQILVWFSDPGRSILEARKRFGNVIDTWHLLEEHHRQLLRDGFYRENKRFDSEKKGN